MKYVVNEINKGAITTLVLLESEDKSISYLDVPMQSLGLYRITTETADKEYIPKIGKLDFTTYENYAVYKFANDLLMFCLSVNLVKIFSSIQQWIVLNVKDLKVIVGYVVEDKPQYFWEMSL